MKNWLLDELTGKNRSRSAQIIHCGALILVVLIAWAWLGEGQHKVRGALSFAATSAFSEINGRWAPVVSEPVVEKAAAPVATAEPALSESQKAVLGALVQKAGKSALTSEEAAVLANALVPDSATNGPIVSRPAPVVGQDAVLGSLIDRARQRGHLSREEQGWLAAAVARLPDSVSKPAGQESEANSAPEPSVDYRPTPQERADQQRDQVKSAYVEALSARTSGILTLGSIDLLLGAAPTALLMLAIWRLRQAMLATTRWGLRSDQANRRFDQTARTGAVALMLNMGLCGVLMAQVAALADRGDWVWRSPEPPEILAVLAAAAALWWGVPRLLRLKFKPAKRKRDLEMEVEALKARADALAEENSQFV
ncbi:MAG: hypothetical protein JWM33_3208 [Caulobacteraceae bacterium]|nr:hypothetical protein [Caulobacteraceae bacterium]